MENCLSHGEQSSRGPGSWAGGRAIFPKFPSLLQMDWRVEVSSLRLIHPELTRGYLPTLCLHFLPLLGRCLHVPKSQGGSFFLLSRGVLAREGAQVSLACGWGHTEDRQL